MTNTISLNFNEIQKPTFETAILKAIQNVNNQTINLFLYKNYFMYISNFNALFSKQFDAHRHINRNIHFVTFVDYIHLTYINSLFT